MVGPMKTESRLIPIQHFEQHRAIMVSSLTVRSFSSWGTGPRNVLFARDKGGVLLFLRDEGEKVGEPPSEGKDTSSGRQEYLEDGLHCMALGVEYSPDEAICTGWVQSLYLIWDLGAEADTCQNCQETKSNGSGGGLTQCMMHKWTWKEF
jgi:hypothetical protein